MNAEDSRKAAALTARLGALSPEKRALLARQLAERSVVRGVGPDDRIAPRPEGGPAPLSYAQELLWLYEQMTPGTGAYNLPIARRVRGPLDVSALERAFGMLIARHESLRTRFVEIDGGPRQAIDAPGAVAIERHDLRAVPAEERAAVGERVLHEAASRPFDLTLGTTPRVVLAALADGEALLLIVVHHIVFDGASAGVLMSELAVAYEAALAGREPDLAPLPIQLADVAAWERREIDAARLEPALAFWREQLDGAPSGVDLPSDFARPPGATGPNGRHAAFLSAATRDAVRSLASTHGVTPFMVLMAAFQSMLHRYSGENDLVVGTAVAGRSRAGTAGLVGFLANALPLRARFDDDPSFADLLTQVRERTLRAFDHQEVPYEKLARELRAGLPAAEQALFRATFSLQDSSVAVPRLGAAIIEPLGIALGDSKFDLSFSAVERPRGIDLVVEYRRDLYRPETIERMPAHLETLLLDAASAPRTPVSRLALLTPAERDLVVRAWNDTARTYPDGDTLASLLARQASRTPDAIAVLDARRSLTYAELDARAHALARTLQTNGVRAGVLVAVCAERSAELVIALLAIVKAGGAYVPLDPDYPADRLAFMLEDAGAPVYLAPTGLAHRLSPGARLVALDDVASRPLSTDDAAPLAAGAGPADPAYMIYTSGSTGRPKGALNAHRGIVNRLRWMHDEYALGPADVVLQKTPFSFDVSVWEFFWPLIAGARLVMAEPGGHRDPAYLARTIAAHGVTVCHFVPSMLAAFVLEPAATQCATLRDVMASGEALAPDLVAAFSRTLPGARLHNLYGPTECAVDVTYWPCPPGTTPPAVVPIGRPVANTQVYVLDARLQPVPVGVPGELYLAGVQVGMGYHRRPELTVERFLPDPFSATPDARMYRTGDRARWRADGTVEYLGRLDFQVKVRGFRIELGEIESTLTKHPAVAQAAVVLREERGGELVAYVVPDAERAGAVRRAVTRDAAEGPPTFDLPNGVTVFHRNRTETEFLFKEIFEGEGYLGHGLAIRDGDVVFDVGANIGMFAVFAGTHVRGARVYAFEPIPPLFDALRANAELHGIGGRVFPCGLGSRDETVTFTYYPENTVLSGRYANVAAETEIVRRYITNTEAADAGSLDELLSHKLQGEAYSCRIRTLSDVVREEAIDRIDLLKVDVEKAEWDVLLGIDDADWAKVRQVVMEVHDDDGRLARVLDLLRAKGFDVEADQESMLSGTALYSVYARRPGVAAQPDAPAAEPCETRWHGATALRGDLHAHLSRDLPAHMVPGAIVFLDALPLTASGKLDRRALPALRHEAPVEDLPPSGPVEEVVASVFRQALQVERVGRSTSFFQLGGHSLLVTRVVATLAKLVRVQLPIRAMFDSPTVAGVAAALVAGEAAPGQTARVAQLVLKLQSQQAAARAAGDTPAIKAATNA